MKKFFHIKFMRINYLFFALSVFSGLASAGIETELAQSVGSNQCVIDIEHDATPDSETGTLVIRTYINQDGVHQSCDVEQNEIADTLDQALSRYLETDLKAATFVFVGRLIEYAWVREFLEQWSDAHDPASGKISREELQEELYQSGQFSALQSVLLDNDIEMTGLECEKILYYDTGVPQDAMCWLIISSQ